MLTTPHALLGIALATKLPLFLGLPLALLSHFALDFLVPHWNPHLYTETRKNGQISSSSVAVIFLDGLLTFALLLYFAFSFGNFILPLAGAILATLPDWVEIPYYFLKIRHPLLVRYVTFEHNHQARANFFLGIITQLAAVLVSLWWLFAPSYF